MKNTINMIDQLNKDIANKQPNNIPSEQASRGSGDFIHGVFKALKLTFPAWRNNFKTEKEFNATKQLWLQALIEEKITSPEQINRALKAARNHDSPFFPSIGQFMGWAREPEKEKPRINEQAYKLYKPKLAPYTQDEYKEMGERGLDKIKALRRK